MRKKIILPIVMMALCVTSYHPILAQNYNHSVSVGIGTATPLGDFGSLDVDNENAGGATGGSCLDLELKSLIPNANGIGAIFMLKTQANAVSKKFMSDAGLSEDEYTVGAWSLQGYMGGAFYEFRSSEKFFVQPKIMIGALTARSPYYDIYLLDELIFTRNSATATAFSSLLGIDFGVDLGRFRLQGQYDFMFAKPTFNGVDEDYIMNTEDIYSLTQKMRTYNVKFSIGYNFGKR
jgi:hypothetical protein